MTSTQLLVGRRHASRLPGVFHTLQLVVGSSSIAPLLAMTRE